MVAGYSEIQMIKYALTQSKGATDAKTLASILEKARNGASADGSCHLFAEVPHSDQGVGQARSGPEREAERERAREADLRPTLSLLTPSSADRSAR